MPRNCASVSGKLCANKLKGMALRGPAVRWSCRSKYTSLSPPRPLVRTSTASTMVRQAPTRARSEEHTSELQSHLNLVCRLLLEKKKKKTIHIPLLKKKKNNKNK